MTSSDELILYGVFRGLRARNIPLGIRDYLDALRAMRLGFGRLGREPLRRLCHALWARSPREARLINLLFEEIPLPTDDEVRMADETLFERVTPGQRATEASGRERSDLGRVREDESPSEGGGVSFAISFAPSQEPEGLPLPRPQISSTARLTFVLEPQTVLSRRDFAVAWRRFRRMTRTGPRTEIDIDQTIHEKCARGVVADAVFRPARCNTARLLILADVSSSMARWLPSFEVLSDSLRFGRLGTAEVFYFDNVPRRSVFRSTDRRGRLGARPRPEGAQRLQFDGNQ